MFSRSFRSRISSIIWAWMVTSRAVVGSSAISSLGCKIRGKEIAMIFQEPMSALNPVFTCGYQISEVLHLPKAKARARAIELMKLVGIPLPEMRVDEYPPPAVSPA